MGGAQFLVEEGYWHASWLLPWISDAVLVLALVSATLWLYIGWEWFRSREYTKLFQWGQWGAISLEDAAQRAYEILEKSGLDPITRTNFSSPQVGLDSMRYLLAYHLPDVQMIGARRPSQKLMPIPRSEIRKLRFTGNALEPIGQRDGPGYENVRIKRRDFRRVMADYVVWLKQHPQHDIAA